jgi:poly-gamma-glutamate synthesis protein (capsule biosynthesis protein)
MPVALFVLWIFSSGAYSQSQQQDSVVTLLFAGDVTLADALELSLGNRTVGVFDNWNVGGKDLFMVNLENPITNSLDTVPKEFNFRMHPKYVDALRRGSIDVVNLANNHTFDFGTAGLFETMRILDSVGIPYVGAGTNLDDSRQPLIYTLKGMRIGFLGFHGRGAVWNATPSKPGVAPRTEKVILKDVAKLRPLVDFLVVNFHWGTELAETPDRGQILLAHQTIDAGADLIVGHHPHVLQGIEEYRGKVIAYSLGNFVFGGNARANYETAILRVKISSNGNESEIVPVEVRNYHPRLAAGKTSASVLRSVKERSKIFKRTILQLN